ncbi:class I SAM-dependent methyltransferase [Halobaculum halobium]|uniref:Class I SAM-dependent methyltransferase n=1 Tax=Halobaculum halobium TaxID=3032281 RepID=A0ABD5TGL1_9EURY|nr:class I SAM-dependent methyltransferase [Halobaculum sp. SYNS20]
MVRSDKIEYISRICAGKNVLHLGCVGNEQTVGADRWLHAKLHEVSENCVGMDIDESGVEEMNEQGYHAVVDDAQNFHVDDQFDVIVAGEIIEHLANPGGMFESARRTLSEGGTFIITTPNPFALIRFIKYISPIHEFSVFEEHVSWFDRITLSQFASRYGFVESDHYYAKADTFGLTQILHDIGFEKFEDDFIGVYRLNKKPGK